MKPQITSDFKIFAGLLLLALFLGVYNSYAQGGHRITQVAFESSMKLYGHALETCRSTDVEMRVLSRGLVAGAMVGNEFFKTRFRLAALRSTSFVKNKFVLQQSELLMNFYPLEFMRTCKNVLDISLTMGVAMNRFRFQDNRGETMAAAAVAVNQVMGVGIEYHLPSASRLVHFFAEGLFSSEFYSTCEVPINGKIHTAFASLNFGVRFGSITKRGRDKCLP